jgi:serine protease Do
VGLPSLAPLVEKVKSGVVSIRAVATQDIALEHEGPSSGGVVTGTGFLIHSDGLVLTNHHLVSRAEQIIVYVPGHRPSRAVVTGEDPVTDLAVLRLDDPPEDPTVLELGRSEKLRQGDWVFTLGNPFEQFEQTLTVGVVSFLGRQLSDRDPRVTNDYLQFSAAVNPGSSGGPVLDLDGHVVGITARTTIAGQGLSFAIPSKKIKWVLDAMENSPDGRVHWGFMGVSLGSLSRDSADEGQEARGALVTGVTDGEGAQRAGLRTMDVLVSFNGQSIRNAADLHCWIRCSPPGTTVILDVLRNGQAVEPLQVVLGEIVVGGTSTITH